MEGFELTIVINRPIEGAFGFLSNLENDVKWRREWVDAKQRVTFSDLDPYNHVRTAAYSRYYVDHRMNGLRENVGWE